MFPSASPRALLLPWATSRSSDFVLLKPKKIASNVVLSPVVT